MASKSVSQEADDILLASSMITLGARLQVLEAETSLSHDRLARLYREIRGCSPPKGMLPFSVDWFMTWLPNIHSSLFYNVYSFLNTRTSSKGIRATIDAYRLYLENAGMDSSESAEPVLSSRGLMLVRFFDSGMLQPSACRQCGGHFHRPRPRSAVGLRARSAGRHPERARRRAPRLLRAQARVPLPSRMLSGPDRLVSKYIKSPGKLPVTRLFGPGGTGDD